MYHHKTTNKTRVLGKHPPKLITAVSTSKQTIIRLEWFPWNGFSGFNCVPLVTPASPMLNGFSLSEIIFSPCQQGRWSITMDMSFWRLKTIMENSVRYLKGRGEKVKGHNLDLHRDTSLSSREFWSEIFKSLDILAIKTSLFLIMVSLMQRWSFKRYWPLNG